MKAKVLGISGSPIKNSNTDRVIQSVLTHTNLAAEFIKLSKLTVQPCIACLGCTKDNVCKVQDDFQILAEKVKGADAIVVGGYPPYGSIDAFTKAFLERLFSLLLDIDFFKKVNDGYGHPAGDHVLKMIADCLVKLVRRCDIVARYGGEEFGVILPETGVTSAKVLGQRIRRGIEQLKIVYNEQQISVTTSCGVASSEKDMAESTRQSLINKADEALYTAKKEGRNRVVVFVEFEDA